MKNVTITLEENVAKWAKVWAAKHDSSLSRMLNLDFELLKTAYQAISTYSLSWWDALIIAAAKVCGCKSILSEDFSTEKDYFGLRVINPFVS